MTNLEAITASVLYPIKSNSLLLALGKRGLVSSTTYDATDPAQLKSMELAIADSFVILLTAPNSISEGGYSISFGDRKELKDMAAFYYSKYGEELSGAIKRPAVRGKNPW